MEIQRRLGMTSGTSNSTGSASSSPRNHRRRGHRRQMSDPKIFSSISPIKEDKDLEKELERVSWVLILRSSPLLISSVCSSAWHIFHCLQSNVKLDGRWPRVIYACSWHCCYGVRHCTITASHYMIVFANLQDLMERDLCAMNVEEVSYLCAVLPESEKEKYRAVQYTQTQWLLSYCVMFLAFLLLFICLIML